MTNILLKSCSILALLLSIFSCFGKKEKKDNLDSWLNQHFPDHFEVINNRHDLQPKNLILKKITSVVAAKDDPEVQFVLMWFKDKEDLGLTTIEVQSAFEHSKRETAESRQLLAELIKHGATFTSVCVIDDAAYFLVYANPSAENRGKYLQQIISTLDEMPDHNQTSIWIEFMEDSAYHREFKDIIPKGYWDRVDSYHERHKIVSLYFDWTPKIKPDQLLSPWTINVKSGRSETYRADAFRAASQWAEKNISGPFYLEPDQMVEFEVDDKNHMAIHFHFPYFPAKPAEDNEDKEAGRIGYISGVYQVDNRTFSKIEKGTEF
ncbi:MAG: hypothetical protein ABJB16_14505 [Saprospiraceae bacterium]